MSFIEPNEKPEMVDHPAHYQGAHECIDVMRALFGDKAVADFCRCNAFKYRFRAGMKNGAEDIRKAEWYEGYLMDMLGMGGGNDAPAADNCSDEKFKDALRKEASIMVSEAAHDINKKTIGERLEELAADTPKIQESSGALDNISIGEFVEKTQKRAAENAARKILGNVETNCGKKIPVVTGVYPETCSEQYLIGTEGDIVRIHWESVDEGVEDMADGNKLGILGITVYPHNDMTLNDCMKLAEEHGFGHSGALMVEAESTLSGKCFCYGNHGKFWEQTGTTCGYA